MLKPLATPDYLVTVVPGKVWGKFKDLSDLDTGQIVKLR